MLCSQGAPGVPVTLFCSCEFHRLCEHAEVTLFPLSRWFLSFAGDGRSLPRQPFSAHLSHEKTQKTKKRVTEKNHATLPNPLLPTQTPHTEVLGSGPLVSQTLPPPGRGESCGGKCQGQRPALLVCVCGTCIQVHPHVPRGRVGRSQQPGKPNLLAAPHLNVP